MKIMLKHLLKPVLFFCGNAWQNSNCSSSFALFFIDIFSKIQLTFVLLIRFYDVQIKMYLRVFI